MKDIQNTHKTKSSCKRKLILNKSDIQNNKNLADVGNNYENSSFANMKLYQSEKQTYLDKRLKNNRGSKEIKLEQIVPNKLNTLEPLSPNSSIQTNQMYPNLRVSVQENGDIVNFQAQTPCQKSSKIDREVWTPELSKNCVKFNNPNQKSKSHKRRVTINDKVNVNHTVDFRNMGTLKFRIFLSYFMP